ncbi:MAG: bifunctional UDP-sugar hydrolase/5'-nucleotidase [Bdellovibrionota bacterium]
MHSTHWFLAFLTSLGLSLQALAAVTLAPQERLLVILGTNDIHGGIEPSRYKDGKEIGGMAQLTGAANAIRKGIAERYGNENAGVVLLDGGDQFQGSLLSNFDEGELLFKTMNKARFDAVVPGNHDYDFGPKGWLEDQVTERTQDKDPRGSLKNLVSIAQFPLLSANTYLKTSLRGKGGSKVDVDAECNPLNEDSRIAWSMAKRPEFLKPYHIKTIAGVRVALIGLDNHGTHGSTTAANVADLCFRDEVESYLDVRRKLHGKADIFIIVMHQGDSDTETNGSEIVRQITQRGGHPHLVHAVIAGHTHFPNDLQINGVPIIQSESGGKKFGRIDLVWDTAKKSVVASKSSRVGSIGLFFNECDKKAKSFCSLVNGKVHYEGVEVIPDAEVLAEIAHARERIRAMAEQKIAIAEGKIWKDRINESPLANALTDTLRKLAAADVAVLNTGGIRSDLNAGEITYEEFFKVIPFNNRAVVVGPMTAERLVGLIAHSITTCGSFGSLMQSGLRVKYERDCKRAKQKIEKLPPEKAVKLQGTDPDAKLVRIETLAGEVVFESGQVVSPERSFTVATVDFIASGGDRFAGFVGVPVEKDLGILREELVKDFVSRPTLEKLSPKRDDRWLNVVSPN